MKAEVACTHRLLETPHRATRETTGRSGCRLSEEKMWARARAFIVVFMGRTGEAGLGLAGLNKCSEFWGIGGYL